MSDQPFGEGDPYADLRQPGKVCEHEKLQRQCDLCFVLRDVELLRARIAELEAEVANLKESESMAWSSAKYDNDRATALEAENKRLVEERDGWKREAKLSRTILEELKKQKAYEIANRLIPGGALLCSAMGSLCRQLLDARAANDARAGQKENEQ